MQTIQFNLLSKFQFGKGGEVLARHEKDVVQYRKNTKIELLYCIIQAAIALFGYYSKLYWAASLLLVTVTLVYILWINPKYMNRRMTKQKEK